MNDNKLQTFTFTPGMSLRTITREGTPWFVAKDVADSLGFADAHSAAQHLDDDERANLPVEGFARGAIIVNESGLYSLILRSRKPEAKAFRKWITAAVLPALRQGGVYVVGQEKVDLASMNYEQARLHIEELKAKVAEAENTRWAKSREEIQARASGLRLVKRRIGRRAPKAARAASKR